ncbi:DUF2061 domain-containing protein [Erythrobacter sp. BLCC-B19]|uniref:DUF2061 domain-containing protein n=1 Tax=Erythrobacter sp. BLCC-B19 TaxID=3025315 RepID=UPI0023625EBA|nr:DUF2061 domain-containing protein [Erythrobacter sp. BLCC-B19]WDA41837.1 DUF2061 domain-containing protein [Erythrobacter sp. BLCC-B19]
MFVFRGREAHSRSLAKALSWRILGSIDTFLLSWLFTRSAKAAGAIAITEVLTKMVLYYFHERAWSSVRWGVRSDQPEAPGELREEPAL